MNISSMALFTRTIKKTRYEILLGPEVAQHLKCEYVDSETNVRCALTKTGDRSDNDYFRYYFIQRQCEYGA